MNPKCRISELEVNSTKILFISCTLPPENSATGILVANLSNEFIKNGYYVDGISLKESLYNSSYVHPNGMNVYRINHLLSNSARHKRALDVIYIIAKRFIKLIKNKQNAVYRKYIVRAFVRKLKKLASNQYDVIIAVCAYYDAIEAVMKYQRETGGREKCILYQVDPLTENVIYHSINHKALDSYERKLYAHCDVILTTPLIYALKKGWDLHNVVPVEFPALVMRNSEMVITKAQDEIRCIFAGYLYENLRDAHFTLELFSRFEDRRIHLYFIGSGQEDLLNQYMHGVLAGRLHPIGRLTSKDCDAWLSSADVLINIGNKISNQVPSKLINYLSYGKTILNVVACKNCPSIEYMQRYPLAINIREVPQIDDVAANQIENAIHAQQHIQLPFHEVRALFPECTPEYVVRQIIDAIS